jgi:cell wall assembly regulator SMI1
MIEREILKRNLEQFLAHMKELNCDCKPFIFEPPATEAEIVTVETELGYTIPSEFRQVLLTISAHCEFQWFLPDDFPLTHELRQIFAGDIHWGLKFIKNFEEQRIEWIKAVFPNPDDEYDKIWHNKFAFYEVGNGDMISIDLSEESYGQIVYLSHDDGDGHGYVLANSLD